MKKEKLIYLKELLKKERTVTYLEKELEISSLEILGYTKELKEEGNNVSTIKKDGEIFIINYGDQTIEENKFKIQHDSNIIRLGLISDTRFGSKYQQLSLVNNVYQQADRFNVDYILHLGDICEGVYTGKKSIYNDSIFIHGIDEQKEYIVENYPYVEGITTYFLTGEHDMSHINANDKRDIGKLIENKRDDLIYLGQNQCKLEINNLKIYLEHMTSNRATPLTISYRPQETIRTIRSEDKPDFFFQGHNFQSQMFKMRNIQCFSVPSLVATTPEMLNKASYNTVGAWFLEITCDKRGRIKELRPIGSPYYKTFEEDYKNAKVLRRVK